MNMSPGQFSPKKAKRIAAPPLVAIENNPPIVEASFRAAVRGEQPVKEIPVHTGLREARQQSLCPADVAEGIINLKNDPLALSEWAIFILATGDASKVRGAESDYWDRLLSGIWEIALGSRPSDPVVALAYAIRARQSLA